MTIKKLTKTPFFYIVIIVIIACLMAISTLLVCLWSYLEKYESTTPQFYIENFVTKLKNGDIVGVMKEVDVKQTDFFKADDYKTYMNEILGEDISKIKTYEINEINGNKIYELSCDGKKSITIELLSQKDKKKHGASKYTIKQSKIPMLDMTILAPSHIKVMANDVKLSDKYKTNNKQSVQCFNVLNDQSIAPQIVSYKIDGFIKKPKISIEGLLEQEYKIIEKDNVLTITIQPTIIDKDIVEKLAVEASKAYANFISKDGKFADFSKYLFRETSFNKSVRNFDNSWYIEHDSFAFDKLNVCNTIAHSENHFSTEVSFDYIIKRKKTISTYEVHYKLSFIKQDDNYKIVNLEVI